MLLVQSSNAQSFDQVKEAIAIGSSKEVAKFFENSLEVTIDGKTSNYSKTQAEFVVKDFFQKNPVSNFKIIHNGNSQGGLIYAIGKYQSGQKSYRTLIRMRDNKVYNISFTLE